ncbi:XrtA/PEP-CTERM system-associated ATPase [Noviherbaspirillum suwonense]|jgi:general secretion pathway protein A|uniref:Secretion ATPase, PEP-CTERM locus subfamily n=1 Tax=Noviherbaspirillum suwonense TaxID=1224511 RepID=A0ABY1QIF7_9BURK|nr:XrtA/PEP-CTERM system-associated ATPase [Noviherbaspirillum suwonense]SMP69500.1 putative secretion ATPase, PEP-CTERM locus subfamily [Noviherbaspirillum suwonense]
MYETFYGLHAKPFQLRPDPNFFFGSKGHKRAMSYLEYGLSQGEGFIVITGEVGAGKTTLVRNLFRKLETNRIIAAQIVNTHLNSDDTLRSVVAAFGLPFDDPSKTGLLARLEQFLRYSDKQGKRVLLVVDEAQNLTPQTVEELRMLSNFQTNEKSLLQTFLLGQPEFRRTLHSEGMQQLRQRVIATYHLGPMDAAETQLYIEHRLQTAGWKGDPVITPEAYAAIYDYSGGIPRKINTLCDRLFLMGYLEELHQFGADEVGEVIKDIQEEFTAPPPEPGAMPAYAGIPNGFTDTAAESLEHLDERLSKIERSVTSVLDVLKRLISTSKI